MEKITFLNHYGSLNPSDNSVIFYGLQFKDVCVAKKSLKDLIPGEVYYMWCYNYHIGFINEKTKQVFIDNRWMPNEKFAESYIDMKK